MEVDHAADNVVDAVSQPEVPAFCIREDFQNKYSLRGKIGSGAFGKAIKCYPKTALVAKEIDLRGYNGKMDSVAREAMVGFKHRHPNLMEFKEVYVYERPHPNNPNMMRSFMTLIGPLMNGGSLDALIYQTELVNGQPSDDYLHLVTQQDVSTILHDMLAGIAYLHERGFAHRDLKPDNVLLDAKTGLVKLTDYGYANKFSPSDERFTVAGTAEYVPPEISNNYLVKREILDGPLIAQDMRVDETAEYRKPEPPNFVDRQNYTALEYEQAVITAIRSCQEAYDGMVNSMDLPDHWEDFRDFVARCLRVEPTERAHATELLEHAFLKKRPPCRKSLKSTLRTAMQHRIKPN